MGPNFVYVWKPEIENIYKGKDVTKVANEIFSISDNPTNAQIVEKAKDESTELHSMFEWNDTRAAQKYREQQAHKIVTSIQIIPVGLNNKGEEKPLTERPIRLLHHLNGNPGYIPIHRIMNDEVMHRQLLEQAYSDLRAFQYKYATLQELQPIFALIPQ